MKKLIFTVILLLNCSSTKSLYTDNIKDGLDIIKTYRMKVIKIDTLKNKSFIIHYKDLPEED
jgi:hypothetical protein